MAAPRPSGIAEPVRSLLGRDGTEDAPAVPSKSDRFDGGGLADAIDWIRRPIGFKPATSAISIRRSRGRSAILRRADVIELASKLALDPLVLVIGLLARTQADRNRSAARIARAIFGKRPRREVDEAATAGGDRVSHQDCHGF